MGGSAAIMVAAALLLLLAAAAAEGGVGIAAAEAEVLMRVKAGLDPDGKVLKSWYIPGGSFDGVAWNGDGKVANISLQGKGLSGWIPSAIADLASLSALFLHYNRLSGPVPSLLYKLPNLSDLYLNVNNLSGTIPPELGLLYSLRALQLCCNRLEGDIPMELGALKQLNVLSLQHNYLSGTIPSSFAYLDSLTRLDLSFNQLNGSIPAELAGLPHLTSLDVASNYLSGPVPAELKRLQQGFVYDNNSMLCGDGFIDLASCTKTSNVPDQPLAGARPTPTATIPPAESTAAESADPQPDVAAAGAPQRKPKTATTTMQVAVISGVAAFAVGGIIIGLLIFVLFRRHKQKISSAFEVGGSSYKYSNPFSDDARLLTGGGGAAGPNHLKSNSSSKLDSHFCAAPPPSGGGGASSAAGSHRISRSFGSSSGIVFFNGSHQSFQYDLEELEMATNYFSDKNLLGKRAPHSAVYKGLLRDGSCVAIRALHRASCKAGISEFKSAVAVIAQLRHENIVTLKGFCCSSGKADFFLVYDFMTNGTLQDHLERKKPRSTLSGKALSAGAAAQTTSLDWTARSRIATNIARGLHFMHRGTDEAVVHQNVSAANVLLDENCNACVSDAGLHRLLADDIVFAVLKSSAAKGYLSPEYVATGRLTEKSDVYAVGVLLLQLLTGQVPAANHHNSHSHHHDHDQDQRYGENDGVLVRRRGNNNNNNMVSWARSLIGSGCVEELMDPALRGKYSGVAATHMAAVAFACTHEEPAERPDMSDVVKLLEKMDACAETVLESGLSSGEDYPRRQQALFAERLLLDNGR